MIAENEQPSDEDEDGHDTPHPLNTLTLQLFAQVDSGDCETDVGEDHGPPDEMESHFFDAL